MLDDDEVRAALKAQGYTDEEIDEMEENDRLQADIEAAAIDAVMEEFGGFDTLAEQHEYYEEARRETFD